MSVGNQLSERGLWRLPVGSRRTGVAQRVPLSVGTDATNVAYNARSRRLVYSRSQIDVNTYRVSLRGPGQLGGEPEPFIGSTRLEYVAEYSPGGDAVAFTSTRSGSEEIWVANADGSNPRQLTAMAGPDTAYPRWSPDGQTIAFHSRNEGSRDLYLVSPQGGTPRRLTADPTSEALPAWSRDGRFLYFASDRTGRDEVWKMPAAGGQAVQVTRNGGAGATESPDGRWLYYARRLGIGTELWKMPLAGGEESLVLDDLSLAENYVVTAEGIYYVQAKSGLDRVSLAFLNLRSRKVEPLLRTNGLIFVGLSVSPDRHSLLYSQTDARGADLMLVEGFR